MTERSSFVGLSFGQRCRLLAIVNQQLAREKRSPLSVRQRAMLDRVENLKQKKGRLDQVFRYPDRYRLIMEGDGRIWIGCEEIERDALHDAALEEGFRIQYLDAEGLDEDLISFLDLLRGWDTLERLDPPTVRSLVRGPSIRWKRTELIVDNLKRIYDLRLDLEPYLGGVGSCSQETKQPSSAFGAFAKFVLDELDVRSRTGSLFSINTIKNAMNPKPYQTRKARHRDEKRPVSRSSAGAYAQRLAPDEPELIRARDELLGAMNESKNRPGNT